jgi:hypothetical protein
MSESSSAAETRVSRDTLSADRRWFIVGRWQEFEGEAKANLLRIIGIGAFYTIELLNYHGLRLGWLELPQVGGVDERFHRTVTALAAAWTMTSQGILFCLRRQVFPWVLKYLSTAADLVFLTGILLVADGARSPLLVGYFLIIALAGLRFSLPLVWFATCGCLCGYLFLLGYAKWFAAGSPLRVERYQQLIFLVALALAGIVLGQIIRRVRRIAEDYAARLHAALAQGARDDQ